MPYAIQNGVRTYSDHDTPPEFASAADEERYAYNEAQATAFRAAEEIAALIDKAHGENLCTSQDMGALAIALLDIKTRAKALLRVEE
jgi:hypothetical protein